MNKKQLISAIVICIVLAVTSYIMMNTGNKGWGNEEKNSILFKDFTVSEVAKIAIKKGNKSATIAKNGNQWVVETRDNYPANFTKIKNVTLKIKDLKIAQKIRVGKSRYDKLELDKNIGTSVSFLDAENNEIASMLLGKNHMQKSENPNPNPMYGGGPRPDGRYILVDNIDNPILITETLSSLSEDSSDWLNSDFVKIEKVKSMILKQGDKTLWSVQKDKKDGKLAIQDIQTGEDFDESKVGNISSAVNYMSFNDVSKTKLENPYVITIETFDSIKYVLSLVKKETKHYLSVEVYANFAEKRTSVKDEKKEDTDKLDKAFTENLKKLKDKIAKEEIFHGWSFEISDYKYNSLVKLRKDLFKDKKEGNKK